MVASHGGNNLVAFHYLIASEIWPLMGGAL